MSKLIPIQSEFRFTHRGVLATMSELIRFARWLQARMRGSWSVGPSIDFPTGGGKGPDAIYQVAGGGTRIVYHPAPGLIGLAGADGTNGTNGLPGMDATEPGPQGPVGSKGAKGPKGDDGPVGPLTPGRKGTDSTTQGLQGLPGPDGLPGERGQKGIDGLAGNDYVGPGEPGDDGPEGLPGEDSTDPTKTALLPSEAHGIIAMHGLEGTEPWFKDSITLPLMAGRGSAFLDPVFLAVCEPGTLLPQYAAIPGCGAAIGAEIETSAGRTWLRIHCHPAPPNGTLITASILGLRRGFIGQRLPLYTAAQYEANNAFYRRARS